MIILGVGGFEHDANSALIEDGRIVAAVEEERLTRKKHQNGWPENAINFCLKYRNITEKDVDHLAFYWAPFSWDSVLDVLRRLKYIMFYPMDSAGFILHSFYTNALVFYLMRLFRERSKGKSGLHFVRHHDCHAASAFYCSPFERSAVLSIDSRGELATSVCYIGEDNSLHRVSRINLPHSIGVVYLCVTNYLGFSTGDEYKVMGLAGFGEPVYLDKFRKIVKLCEDGTYRVDTSYFNVYHSPGRYKGYVTEKFLELFGPPRYPDEEITQRHKDIAASLQAILEETVFHILRWLYKKAGTSKLCIAGGVAQNSVMCGKITSFTDFDGVFIQPAAGDNGTSLGAALWVHNMVLKLPRSEPMKTAYLGPSYSQQQIKKVLDESKFKYIFLDNPEKKAAQLVAEGKIVAWFQDRMEWGARALGNRSILADVTNPEMTAIVNRYVKHREDFRPFAPACLEEKAAEFFEIDGPSPFMLKVFRAREKCKKLMPAIVHVDGTSRLQTVNKIDNPKFYDLIREFEKLKGVPCVLNTSFNIKGEPIVCSPTDALRCWACTGIDALFIGNYMLVK